MQPILTTVHTMRQCSVVFYGVYIVFLFHLTVMSVDPLTCAGVCAAYLIIKKRQKEAAKKLWIKQYFKQNKNSILRELQFDKDMLFKNY